MPNVFDPEAPEKPEEPEKPTVILTRDSSASLTRVADLLSGEEIHRNRFNEISDELSTVYDEYGAHGEDDSPFANFIYQLGEFFSRLDQV